MSPRPSSRLAISGSGFVSDRYAGENVVFVGTYPCHVILFLTSDTVVGVGLVAQPLWWVRQWRCQCAQVYAAGIVCIALQALPHTQPRTSQRVIH